MSDGSSVTYNPNVFNIVISQLLSVDIKIIEEEKCITLLCSFSNSSDRLFMAIGINSPTLVLEYMIASLLSEEMRWKNMEGSTKDALMVRGQLGVIDRGKFPSRKYKLKDVIAQIRTCRDKVSMLK
jgi:hypothetical protein